MILTFIINSKSINIFIFLKIFIVKINNIFFKEIYIFYYFYFSLQLIYFLTVLFNSSQLLLLLLTQYINITVKKYCINTIHMKDDAFYTMHSTNISEENNVIKMRYWKVGRCMGRLLDTDHLSLECSYYTFC